MSSSIEGCVLSSSSLATVNFGRLLALVLRPLALRFLDFMSDARTDLPFFWRSPSTSHSEMTPLILPRNLWRSSEYALSNSNCAPLDAFHFCSTLSFLRTRSCSLSRLNDSAASLKLISSVLEQMNEILESLPSNCSCCLNDWPRRVRANLSSTARWMLATIHMPWHLSMYLPAIAARAAFESSIPGLTC